MRRPQRGPTASRRGQQTLAATGAQRWSRDASGSAT